MVASFSPKARLYADHNATTPLRAPAKAAMLAALDVVGNPSSVHAEGRAARRVMDEAREALGAVLLCSPQAITFVSGATEGLHLALESAHAQGFGPCLISAVEHDAAWAKAHALYPDARVIPTNLDMQIDRAWLASALAASGARPLVVVQAANNESGAVLGVAGIGDLARAHGGALICDATQALGKLDFGTVAGVADWTVVSSHKIGGPPGAGAVVCAPGVSIVNLRPGGGQESGARAGTQNVPAIAGFAAAAQACAGEDACKLFDAAMTIERDSFEARMAQAFPQRVVISAGARRLSNTSCVALLDWSAERQVIALDLAGAAISAGAACSSGKVRRSRALAASGYAADIAECAVRISFGWTTTPGDGERLADRFISCARSRTRAAKES